jgi:hypothetical protein
MQRYLVAFRYRRAPTGGKRRIEGGSPSADLKGESLLAALQQLEALGFAPRPAVIFEAVSRGDRLHGGRERGHHIRPPGMDLHELAGRPLTPEETGRMRELVRRVGLRLGTWPELYIRTSDEWWHGVYQAAPIRKEIDAEGIEVFRFASGGRA